MDFTKLPNDIGAEQAILGSMIMDSSAVNLVMDKITDDYFYREDNRLIFEAMMNITSNNKQIDLVTLSDELKTMKVFDKVGGYVYIASLPDRTPTTSNVLQYVDIVVEKYNMREIIKTGNDMIALGLDDSQESDSILNLAEKNIFNLTIRKRQKGVESIQEIVSRTIQDLQELSQNHDGITGIPTGYIDFDARVGGLHKSNLIILAARPGMGKSALATNIATNIAMKAGKPVLMFNLEMSKSEITKRILSSEAMVKNDKITKGMLSDSDWNKIAFAATKITESGLYIDDTPGINIMEIRSRARKLKMEKPDLSLIVIDYLQLIQPLAKKNTTREQEISEISRSLKMLAKELDIPIIALSQLSRAVEKGREGTKRPQLSDLRESGAIEQDADVVLFIYREGYYDKDSEVGNQAQIIIAKNRAGATGDVDVLWIPEHTKFVNLRKSE